MTLPWMAAKILLRPVAELRAHSGNARVHAAAQIEQIKASMLAFGFTNPLLVDEAGVLIAGHGRLEAAVTLADDGRDYDAVAAARMEVTASAA